jgi:predicted transcriptional regulator
MKDISEDYQKILKNRGFRKIRLEAQHRRVQARLSWNDVFLLYAIKAFTGTANYRKLIATIAFYLQYNRNGRRYAILLDLASKDTFTTNDIMKQGLPYDKARSYAKYMLKKGYIRVATIGDHGQKNLSLTDKGTKLITLLMQWKQEYQNLKETTNLNDPLAILNTLKNKRPTPYPSPSPLFLNANLEKNKKKAKNKPISTKHAYPDAHQADESHYGV